MNAWHAVAILLFVLWVCTILHARYWRTQARRAMGLLHTLQEQNDALRESIAEWHVSGEEWKQ